MSRRIFFILTTLISCLYLFLRLYHLPILLQFRLDQAIHLSEVKNMVDTRRVSLVGPMVTSQSTDGRHFFIGANYYYLLAVLGLATSWNPLSITTIFIFLELISYLVFVLFIYKKQGSFTALLTYFSIAISPYLINHSRFYWNPHLLIPLSVLAIVWLNNYLATGKYLFLFLSGIAWGFGFSAHYLALAWLPIFIYFLYKKHQFFSLKPWYFIISGFLLGDLPFFIFELRHQFYNLRTFANTYLHQSSSSGLTAHYFIFPFLMFLLYLIAKSRHLLFGLLAIAVFIQFLTNPASPSGSVIGWDYPTQQKVAKRISQSCPSNFNIATTMQGDTRAYDLRFLLDSLGCHPQSVDSYPHVDKLILIAPLSRPPQSETVWEVSSLKPFTIDQEVPINDKLTLYHLSRAN